MIPLLFVAAVYAQEGGTVRHHLAQARAFVKNKWYADAALEVEAALALPEGRDSFDAHWLGAQVYYELVDIDRALPLAERAVALAPGDDARAQAEGFHTFLRDTFGWVEIDAPYPGVVSRLQVESTSVIFDADLKRLVNKVSLDLRERTPLPARVALPGGDYLVNGQVVTVVPGGTTDLRLAMDQLGARGIAALQVTRLEVAAGMSVLFGERVANLHPGGVGELALTQPVGPLLIGVLGQYDLRGYTAAQGQDASSPYAWSAGARVGTELILGGPLAVRPSMGVRYGMVPGIAFACTGDVGSLACVPPGDGEPDLSVYAVGRAVTPFVELSVEYREAGRTTALGTGVKAVVEQNLGTVDPSAGALVFDDPDGTPLQWDATPTTWSATGVRLLANLSIAF